MSKELKIAAVGGGTGLSTMLRGLKKYTSSLTAIVTVSDDGGGSGVLRDDLGMLPPGDIRNCILALADTEPIMYDLLQYRFTDGMLKGQSFGNLFLAAMNGISGSFEEAVRKMSSVLAVTGTVLPVTLADVYLAAELQNGETVVGESIIPGEVRQRGTAIARVMLQPDNPPALPEVLQAIREADLLILGPGSLYTSIIPNLLLDDVRKAIVESNAVRVYICNVMTQPGETTGYTVSDHIRAIEKHTFPGIVQYCIVNSTPVPDNLRVRYLEDGADMVEVDIDNIRKSDIVLLERDLLNCDRGLVRHSPQKLAEAVIGLVKSLAGEKSRKNASRNFSGNSTIRLDI